jgi:CubicO group peptidase (beta-lactamase class C family)
MSGRTRTGMFGTSVTLLGLALVATLVAPRATAGRLHGELAAASSGAPGPPEFPGRAWRRAAPAEVGVDPAGLARALETWRSRLNGHGLERVLVVRRGVVIHEGAGASVANNLYSTTKSFTSTLAGLLLADKGLSVDAQAVRYEPLLREHYPLVTFRHFATMTSGYNAPGGSRWNEPSEDWSIAPYVPAPPLFAAGTRFAYWDEAQMMFGRVLTRMAREDLLAVLDRRVLRPIGARAERWGTEGEVDGIPIRNGCTGLVMDARNLARFGLLFLNEGRWNGRQVVPAEWVSAATRVQVPQTAPPAETDRTDDGRGRYGFNWWVNGVKSDGQRGMPDATPRTFVALGLHHNVCLVVPEWDLVVVRLGEDRSPTGGHYATLNAFLRALAPAMSP